MMKKIIAFLMMTVILSSLMSCAKQVNIEMTERDKEISERIIAEKIGVTSNDLMSVIADVNNIEAITEISTQIVVCRVNKLQKAFVTEIGLLRFIYGVIIEEIYMDVNNMLKVGDTITISTAKGIIKGNDFKELFGNSERAQKIGYANREYEDNEYIASSSYKGIPVEVNKTYIMYLTDMYFESENLYAETGRQFIYEYTNGVLYQGLDYQKMDIDIEQLKNQITTDIKNRTGRVDEIGYDNYLEELGEIQRRTQ